MFTCLYVFISYMRLLPKSIERVTNALARLPGIGPKTASRLTFYLFKLPEHELEGFVEAIKGLRENVMTCQRCFNLAETELCEICRDPKRDQNLICVVEDPLDVMALEQTRTLKGVYHVLGGAISPIDGIGPEALKIAELEARISKLVEEKQTVEVLLATNPSLEGDATTLYIAKILKPKGVKLTKLARGIPVGGDLEYTDELTLSDALNFRKEI